MGQMLCCMRPSTAEEPPRNVGRNSEKTRNLREEHKRMLKVESKMTLEECLKNSPAMNPRVQQPKKRVYPSTSSPGNTPFYTPGKMDEAQAQAPCRRSSRREKLNKKVTFRLPEEDDIILFYSPRQALI